MNSLVFYILSTRFWLLRHFLLNITQDSQKKLSSPTFYNNNPPPMSPSLIAFLIAWGWRQSQSNHLEQ